MGPTRQVLLGDDMSNLYMTVPQTNDLELLNELIHQPRAWGVLADDRRAYAVHDENTSAELSRVGPNRAVIYFKNIFK